MFRACREKKSDKGHRQAYIQPVLLSSVLTKYNFGYKKKWVGLPREATWKTLGHAEKRKATQDIVRFISSQYYYHLYSSRNISSVIRRKKWAGLPRETTWKTLGHAEKRKATKNIVRFISSLCYYHLYSSRNIISVIRRSGRGYQGRLHGRLSPRWEDNTKMNLYTVGEGLGFD
jgi:oligoribonuclease NrnB/cAMP/cGMP phosphodiesterase (DHH superfamily)